MKHAARYVPAVALWVIALSVHSCYAQESVNFASVGGRVTDATGAVLRDAAVKALQTDTNLEFTTLTDAEGRFRIPYLRAGDWQIKVSRPGFAQYTRSLAVSAGAAFELPITLAVAADGTTVTVSGQSEILEAARSQIAGAVTRAEVANVPLNGRSFLDLALLIPGVSATNTGSNQLFAETSAVPGQGISVGSQRNFSNSFLVDGLSANDDAAGLSGVFYGLDTVHEMQVVTSGGQAELGRALGGYINVVTKSGSNTLHGDLYGYFRNHRLNADNPLSNSTLPMTQSQYGASLGGPLQHDRTFYFANYERRQLNQSGLTTISPANADTINARLAAIGYPGARVSTGIYPNPVHMNNALGKIDHQLTSRDQITLRYSLYDVHSQNSRGAGGINAPSASSSLDNTDHTIAVGNVLTLSPRTVNETRGQFTHSDLAALPTDLAGPAVSIAGVATFGTSSGSPTGRVNSLYEVVDNLSHQFGAHAFRAGASFLFNQTRITYPRSFRGSYSFANLASFLNGTYNNSGFSQTFGNPLVEQSNPNVGFYAQDEWKVNSGLTLNLGLRYDLQYLDTIRTDTNNVSPRAGFAWTPFKDRRTVVRGSFGLYYDRVPLRAVANAILSANNTTDLNQLRQIGVALSPTQTGAPVFPNILTAVVPTVTLVNFSTMDRNMQNAYSRQGSLEIERQLGRNSAVSVGFQHLRGLHLIATINRNVPTCVAQGNNNGCRPDPNYANNSQYSPAADSNYNALHVSFVQRPTRWGAYRVSYAWSKSLNNVGEFFFSSPIDPRNIWLDYGRSDDDQRHRVTFNGSLTTSDAAAHTAWQRLSRGFRLSFMLQYYSALPYNITTGAQTIQGTTARPTVNGAFIGRNAGIGNDFFSVNSRLSRSFRLRDTVSLEFLAEAFNSLNHRNNLTRNGNFGTGAFPANPSATYGQITSVLDPRSIQLAARLKF